MQTQLTACRQKLQSLGQQLADIHNTTTSTAPVINTTSRQPDGKAQTKTEAGIINDLFGTDDDSDAEPTEGKSTRPLQSVTAALAPLTSTGGSTALPVHSRGATQDLPSGRGDSLLRLPSRQSSGQAGGALPVQHKQQQALDPAAPKRSISFHNSIRRNPSAAKKRTQAFNDAADAAIAEAAASARLRVAESNASDLASRPMIAPRASDKSAQLSRAAAFQSSSTTVSNSTPSKEADHHSRLQPQATSAQEAVRQQGGRAPSGNVAQTAEPARPHPDLAQPPRCASGQSPQRAMQPTNLLSQRPTPAASKAEPTVPEAESGRTITRDVKAEAAPKLKVGSRLAANMAKLAASRKASSIAAAQPAGSAAVAPSQEAAEQEAQVKEQGKKSTIPEGIRQKLLAQVKLCTCHSCF